MELDVTVAIVVLWKLLLWRLLGSLLFRMKSIKSNVIKVRRSCIYFLPLLVSDISHRGIQWRIQDFPEAVLPTPKGGALTHYFGHFIHKIGKHQTEGREIHFPAPWIHQWECLPSSFSQTMHFRLYCVKTKKIQ